MPMSRSEILLEGLSRESKIIEIGPSYNPIAAKADGWDVYSIDHLSQDGLVEKYKNDPTVDTSRIERVDFVWNGGHLSDSVPPEARGSFDVFIASHVIEHTPDLIAFLESAETLLGSDGVTVLAIPDKRYCFDYFQPLTTTGQILEAHAEHRIRHSRRALYDNAAYLAVNDGATAWGQHPIGELSLRYTLAQTRGIYESSVRAEKYVDSHTWRFTPASFELLLLELAALGETDWRLDLISGPIGCEFYARLRRGGKYTISRLGETALEERRLSLLKRTLLEAKTQIDWLPHNETVREELARQENAELRAHLRGPEDSLALARQELAQELALVRQNVEELLREVTELKKQPKPLRRAKAFGLFLRAGKLLRASQREHEVILRKVRASGLFDEKYYLEHNEDVRVSGVDPLSHFIEFGVYELRNPSPFFDLKWYLLSNPDVRAARVNPLLHYIEDGQKEGRRPYPELDPHTVLVMAHEASRTGAKIPTFPIDKISPDRDTVLVMAHEASRTGASILAWNLVEELQKRYNVVVLLRRGGPLEQAFRNSSSAVICLPDDFPVQHPEALVDRLVRVYSPIYAIANTVDTRYFVPDIEKMGVPVIALVHEFSRIFLPLGVLNSLFETTSWIVFSTPIVAEAAAKDYRSLLEVRGFKILPQGPLKLPPPFASNALAKTDVKGLWPTDSENSLLVVGIGTIDMRKGVEFFISAAAIVHRTMPNYEIRFAWVGSCGPFPPYFEYLKEQIERNGLTDTFVFIGEVEDLQPIYDQANIYFLSSRSDPLPNVAIDSAFNGIPVVCFDQASGMAEILAETADTRELVVPYLDAGATAQLICDVARDPARLARLSQAVRTMAETRFNMARYVEAIDELGQNAITVLDQVKRDHALISKNHAFNTDLYLGKLANTLSADEGLSRYLNASRLVAPRRRPGTGLFARRPLEGFHPLIYASDNPQFDETSGEDPLAHYIRTGRPTGRWTHQVLRPGIRRAVSGTALSIAVHGHFHYPELLPDFIKRLRCNAAVIDFYVTTTSSAKAEQLSKLVAACRLERTKIIVVPNRGRDIGAMLSEIGESVLSGYDVVGHFHGKRTLHFDAQIGDRWRDFVWEHLVGGDFAMIDVVLEAFAQDKILGLVFAEDPHLNGWGDNRACADELARRMGLALPLPNHFDFPIGSMFWARSAALKPLFDLGLVWDDYPEEPLPIDGTILHALERLLPFSADKAGYRYATTYLKGWTWTR